MILTNNQIYNYANNLLKNFNDGEQKLPIKINFYLQKNKKILLDLAQDIEQSRIDIAKQYGTLNEEGTQYNIPDENMKVVQQELYDLLNLEQDVNIYTINFEQIDENIVLTASQMEALMFMINE